MASAYRARAGALLPDGIDLVDEHDARRALLGLREHVAHPACADADKHLLEVAAAHREERDLRLSGNRPRKERLAGSRRPNQQNALWNPSAQALERAGIFQELDDFLDFLACLVDAGNVGERNLLARVLLAVENLCL